MLYSNDKVTYNPCEVTAVTRKIVDSGEMTRSSEDVHFIVVSTTQSLKIASLTIGSQNVWDWSHEYHISGYVDYVGYSLE